MDIGMILAKSFHGLKWTLVGDDYDGLIWDDEAPKPSEKDFKDLWPVVAMELHLERVRNKRDKLLAGSDWTQVADAPVDANAWAQYRQTLRDLPATITDPTADVAWPEPPK